MGENMKKYSEITVSVVLDKPYTNKELSDLGMELTKTIMNSPVGVSNFGLEFGEDERAHKNVIETETDSNMYIEVESLINFSNPRTGKELRHISSQIAELVLVKGSKVKHLWFDIFEKSMTEEHRTLTVRVMFEEPRTAEEAGHFLTETLSEAVKSVIPDKTEESYHYVEVDEGEEGQ